MSDDSSVYGFGPMVLALFESANVVRKETGLGDDDVLLSGTGPEQKAMITYLKEYKTIEGTLSKLNKLYEKDSGDITVFIGSIEEVDEAMATGKIPTQLGPGVYQFAVGVKSTLNWQWDLESFSVPTVTKEAFTLTPGHGRGGRRWLVLEDSTAVGVIIPINYKGQQTVAHFWKYKTDIPQNTDDEDLMDAHASFLRIQKQETYNGIRLPILKGLTLSRPDSMNNRSKLVGKKFGSTDFQIIKAKQTASFDLNEKGGTALSETVVCTSRGGGASKLLDFTQGPFALAIQIIDNDSDLDHTMYVAYYTPPEKK